MSSKDASAMGEENKSGLVPRLRFAEFREAGDWVEITLGEIGEIVTGKTPSTSDDSLWNGDIQFVTPTDISENKYQWNTQRSIAGSGNTKVLPLHSTMFTCIASIGKMALTVKPCITNQQINTVIPNKDYENEFVYYSLLNIVPSIKGTQANSTLPIINKTEFSKFTVPVPKVYDEQQKIADCLSSLDELITAETQALTALKTHKKGLMQQLFPREGEAVPRLRFPEFREAGEWEEHPVSGVLEEALRPVEMDDDEDYTLVTVKRRYGGVVLREVLKGREILVKSQFRIRKDDFLISKRQIVHCACGVVSASYDDAIVSNEYTILQSRKNCDINFFGYFSQQPIVGRSFLECSVGIVIEKMLFKQDQWLKKKFLFPKFPEQQKIASCLSSLDDLIAAQSQKIDVLKTHKKGLMQQLFPVLDEVQA